MMAGHPNGVPLLSLRNLPFALRGRQRRGVQSQQSRPRIWRNAGEVAKDDPKGYTSSKFTTTSHIGWVGRQGRPPWIAKFSRDPIPTRRVEAVWRNHDRFYWLAVPNKEAKNDSLVVAERDGQMIDIKTVEKVGKLLVRLDDRMVNLDDW
jgi:hypothetical protein